MTDRSEKGRVAKVCGKDERTGTDRRAARQWFREYTNSSLVEAMYEWHDQSEAPDEVRSYLQQLADHLLGAPPAVEDGGEDAEVNEAAPSEIWLQPDTEDFRGDTSWCWHEVGVEGEVRYVRADLAAPSSGETPPVDEDDRHGADCRCPRCTPDDEPLAPPAVVDGGEDAEVAAAGDTSGTAEELERLADIVEKTFGAPSSVWHLRYAAARLRGSTEDAPDILRRIDEAVAGKVGFWEMRDLLSKVSVYVRAATEDAPDGVPRYVHRALMLVSRALESREGNERVKLETGGTAPEIVQGLLDRIDAIWRAATEDEGRTVGWVLVGRAEEGVVTHITEGYVRRDRADLDCEYFNLLADGLIYAVHPVGPALTPEPTEETDG